MAVLPDMAGYEAVVTDRRLLSETPISALLPSLRGGSPSIERHLELAKLLTDMVGPTQPAVAELRRILAAIPWYRPTGRCHVACLLAGLLCERGDWSSATRMTRGHWLRRRDTVLQHTTAAGLAALWDFGFAVAPVARDLSEVCGVIDRNGHALQDLLSDRSRRIAVVGNSPVLLGAGQGREIDAHDVVIRFNDFSAEAAFEADTGRKTTIWMRVPGQRRLWRRPPGGFDFVLFGGPDHRFHGAQPWDLVETHRAGGRPACVPTRLFLELVAKLDFTPSSGMTVLYWLRQLRGPLPGANVSLYGFKLDDQTDAVRHYFGAASTSVARHNWSAEASFLQTAILA